MHAAFVKQSYSNSACFTALWSLHAITFSASFPSRYTFLNPPRPSKVFFSAAAGLVGVALEPLGADSEPEEEEEERVCSWALAASSEDAAEGANSLSLCCLLDLAAPVVVLASSGAEAFSLPGLLWAAWLSCSLFALVSVCPEPCAVAGRDSLEEESAAEDGEEVGNRASGEASAADAWEEAPKKP